MPLDRFTRPRVEYGGVQHNHNNETNLLEKIERLQNNTVLAIAGAYLGR